MALASAALAFFSRALQASKSRRRFCRRRLSFCAVGEQGRVRPWEALGDPGLWQDWPTGPSGPDGETEAQTGGGQPLCVTQPTGAASAEAWESWVPSMGGEPVLSSSEEEEPRRPGSGAAPGLSPRWFSSPLPESCAEA